MSYEINYLLLTEFSVKFANFVAKKLFTAVLIRVGSGTFSLLKFVSSLKSEEFEFNIDQLSQFGHQ